MWFNFDQNNSGGNFIVNDNVTHRVIIEADSEEEAIEIGENLGMYWDGCDIGVDCPCCGDRWYCAPSQIDKTKEGFSIEEYAQNLADSWGWCTPDIYIYYKNGKKTSIYSNKTSIYSNRI